MGAVLQTGDISLWALSGGAPLGLRPPALAVSGKFRVEGTGLGWELFWLWLGPLAQRGSRHSLLCTRFSHLWGADVGIYRPGRDGRRGDYRELGIAQGRRPSSTSHSSDCKSRARALLPPSHCAPQVPSPSTQGPCWQRRAQRGGKAPTPALSPGHWQWSEG